MQILKQENKLLKNGLNFAKAKENKGEQNMTNLETYKKVFCDTFNIEEDKLEGLKYQAVEAWDSVGHMGLIASLEDAFNIMFEADDIIDLSSFEKGREILKKYNVEI